MSKALQLISANYLADGAPIWWGENGWTNVIGEGIFLELAEAEGLAAELAIKDATLVVAIELNPLTREGKIPRRQYMRANGPSVRQDLKISSNHEAA